MVNQPRTVAIDGPAASGKSTVGYGVANKLGFLYFDTGAMYRAVTFLALERGIAVSDGVALGKLAEETAIEITAPEEDCEDKRQYTVRVDGEDITWDIRHHLVDANVSEVAAHPEVRAALRKQQRRIGLRGGVVMVGRDIGTVVLPEAPLKVYLDASIEERARRRFEELSGRGEPCDFQALLASMAERDRRDTNRAEAPLRVAQDAYLVNSGGMTVEEVVDLIALLAQGPLGQAVQDGEEKSAVRGQRSEARR